MFPVSREDRACTVLDFSAFETSSRTVCLKSAEPKGTSVTGLAIEMPSDIIILIAEIKFIEVYLTMVVLNESKSNIGLLLLILT